MISLKKLFPALIFFALLAAMVLFFSVFRSFGHLHVRVVDAYTLMPIEHAKVIIPDINISRISDSTGSCVFTRIPLRKNNVHQRILKQDWGECTIIALYAGYRPTVILNSQVYKNQMRKGPTIYMFPEELDDIPVAAIVESPSQEWIIELVEKYSG